MIQPAMALLAFIFILYAESIFRVIGLRNHSEKFKLENKIVQHKRSPLNIKSTPHRSSWIVVKMEN